MVPTIIRETERQALLAVERGEVRRMYRVNGNVLVGPKGVASKTLWRLERNGLIREGKGLRGDGVFAAGTPMVLTPAGKELVQACR